MKTCLSCPPPPPSMDVTIDPKGLVFIRIVSFRCKLHRRRKFGLPEQVLDAGEDVTIINIKCLSSHNHLLSLEFPLTGKAIDYPIELAWGLV